ncbi:MAG: autotransporter domain-containing protein, partial [Alphaproteobacteria bacterium]|nr:autotransporter domain-containing protein [Alphaproteobacteria bacterium]
LTVEKSTFDGNSSGYVGGALGTSLSGSLSISNTTFTNNKAYYDGGAIGNYGGLIISNSFFEGNTSHLDSNGNVVADDTAIGGGAISLGAVSNTTIGSISSTTFKNNRTGQSGGAIANRTNKDGDNTNAKLDISADFIGNSAVVNGGAINNTFFADNGLGKGTGVTISGNFTNNSADGLGGAIFNDTLGIITLNGTNVFSGNKAGGVANDIHNLGTLNISGDLTLDGGITGTGSVVFKEGSTLKANLNGSTIVAGSSVTGSTALVLEGDANGKTFKIDGTETNTLTFADNTLYDITADSEATSGEKTWTVSKKSGEAIAESLGVSETAAQTVAAVTEAQPTTPAASAIVEAITTAAQTGDIATVQELTEKVNPTTTPVVQQQSVAMANQIFNVAGNRMGGIGRSGGDIDVTVGPWIQGLYNKTHNSQGVGFDGYSQGFAVGLDADINEHSLIGFGYGYTATDVKSNGRKTQIYSDNIFLYGKYQPNKWYVSGIANYGHSNYKEAALGLTSKYNVDTYSAAATVGYQEGIFDNYAGLRYSYITPDSYSNGLTTVEGKNAQVGTAVIGTKISKAYKTDSAVWKPEVRLAATYDIKSDNSSSIVGIVGGSSTYMVEGKRQKRFAVEAGVGLTTTVARNLDITLNYDANLRSKQTSQTGAVKLKYSF